MMKVKQRVKSPPDGIAQGFWRFNPNPPPPPSARPAPPPAPPPPPKWSIQRQHGQGGGHE